MPKRLHKQLLYCVLLLLVWLGFVVEGTHALFLDETSLTDNVLTTGTADLQISNSQNGSSTIYADTRPGFALTLSPGQSEDHYFLLKNTSASNVTFDVSVFSAVETGSTELIAGTSLTFMPVDATGNSMGGASGGTLGSLANSGVKLSLSIPAGTTQRFRMTTALSGNVIGQNQSTAYDLIFKGTQRLGG